MNSLTGVDSTANDKLVEEVTSPEAQIETAWAELSKLLTETLATRLPPHFQGLSDYAVSREGIYADHP